MDHDQFPASKVALDTDALTRRERRWLGGRWTRRVLLVAAIIIVCDAAAVFIRGDAGSGDSHAARHLASWQIGFGVGLFVAGWLSRMSLAMLASAATFAILTVSATIIDVVDGHGGPWLRSVHFVEVVAVFLLWRCAPAHLLPWSRRSAPPPSLSQRLDLGEAEREPRLRLVVPQNDDGAAQLDNS